MSQDRDYYCNNKFKFLKIDIENKNTYVCHAAKPHRIDVEWLLNNPGEIFNTDINVQERQQMLRNERTSSCEQNCWFAEDKGGQGPRILQKGYERTHFQIRTKPEIIDVTIGSDCNLQCTYCSKVNSSAWRNEIVRYGNYHQVGESNRYTMSPADRLLRKLSQKEKIQSNYYQAIMTELVALSKDAKEIVITGGEPMLYDALPDMLESLSSCPKIKLFTGLGVSMKRFEKMVQKIIQFPQVFFCVSIENIGHLYEFNRYGMRWTDAENKLSLLQSRGAHVIMHSTLSNLSVFGFPDFHNKFADQYQISVDFVHTPRFMSMYVMDDCSKKDLLARIDLSGIPMKDYLTQTLQITPSEDQRKHLSNFLKQFRSRHSVSLSSVFAQSFLDWLE